MAISIKLIFTFALLEHSFNIYAADVIDTNRVPLLSTFDFGNHFLKVGTNEDQGHLENTFNESTTLCYAHLQHIVSGIEKNEIWAIKFLDAWGKFPAGILKGHMDELGNYDECLSIFNENVTAKYCMTKIPIKQQMVQMPLNIGLGICIPSSCDAGVIDLIIKKVMEELLNTTVTGAVVTENKCTIHTATTFRAIDWVAICVFSLIGIAVLLGTIYDYQMSSPGRVLCPLFMAFSLRANIRSLFRMTSAKDSPNVISCLNGIRVFSISWVIYGHTYMMYAQLPLINLADAPDWRHRLYSMIIQNGLLSVDSFFFLSGLLLVLVALRQMERSSGKINIPLMYVHRYLRLTPVVAVTILFYVSLYRYTGNGPYWNSFLYLTQICNENWWTTILYVQNYINPHKMCLGHSWYLAVDMQLYILSPLVLIGLWKWRRKGLIYFLTVGLLLSVALFVIVLVGDLNVLFTINMSEKDEMTKIYFSTHSRAAPWIVGAAFGYILFCQKGRRTIMSKKFVVLYWILAIVAMIACIYVPYPATYPDARKFTALESAFYLTLSRALWPTALAWIIFACINGYAPIINEFLSWRYWQPFSKLSYCMYVSHLLVQTINAGGTKVNLYFSDYDALLRFYSEFCVTFFVSVLMFVAIEQPMATIERVLLMPTKNITTASAANSKQNLCERSTGNV